MMIMMKQRLVDNAESASMSHKRKGDECDPRIEYFDSKEMLEPDDTIPPTETPKLDDRSLPPINVTIRRVILQENRNFFNNRVNTSMSSVHVPTNVFARGSFIRPFHNREPQFHVFRFAYLFFRFQLVLY